VKERFLFSESGFLEAKNEKRQYAGENISYCFLKKEMSDEKSIVCSIVLYGGDGLGQFSLCRPILF
jgi:hypothetical protein